MSGSKILFDTNVLIRFLQGDRSLIPIMDQADKYISFLTEIELFCKPHLTESEKQAIAALVAACTVIPYREEMRESIVMLRTKYKLKMPDAFIGATALYFQLPIYTFDTGFHMAEPLEILFPK